MSKEGNTQKGAGVTVGGSIPLRSDRVGGHGDQKYSGTKEAYNKAINNSTKA